MTNGGVWRLNTKSRAWTEITPDKPDPDANRRFGYAAVAVDAHDPRVVIASSFNRPNGAGGEDDIFRSIDGETWVWAPQRSPVFYCRDRGATWVQSKGIPDNTRVVADRVNPRKFYGLALFDGKLFVSMDGAATFGERTLALPDGIPRRYI